MCIRDRHTGVLVDIRKLKTVIFPDKNLSMSQTPASNECSKLAIGFVSQRLFRSLTSSAESQHELFKLPTLSIDNPKLDAAFIVTCYEIEFFISKSVLIVMKPQLHKFGTFLKSIITSQRRQGHRLANIVLP